MRCEMQLKAAKPAHEGVPAADMTIFQTVFRTAKSPPSMVEFDPKKGSFLASETRIVCKAEKDAVKDGKPVKGCGRPIPMESKTCPYCGSGETYLLYGNECVIKEIEAETEDAEDD